MPSHVPGQQCLLPCDACPCLSYPQAMSSTFVILSLPCLQAIQCHVFSLCLPLPCLRPLACFVMSSILSTCHTFVMSSMLATCHTLSWHRYMSCLVFFAITSTFSHVLPCPFPCLVFMSLFPCPCPPLSFPSHKLMSIHIPCTLPYHHFNLCHALPCHWSCTPCHHFILCH